MLGISAFGSPKTSLKTQTILTRLVKPLSETEHSKRCPTDTRNRINQYSCRRKVQLADRLKSCNYRRCTWPITECMWPCKFPFELKFRLPTGKEGAYYEITRGRLKWSWHTPSYLVVRSPHCPTSHSV